MHSYMICIPNFNGKIVQITNYAFFSLLVLYAALLPDLYFWSKTCVLYSNFYGKHVISTSGLCWGSNLQQQHTN